MSEPSAAPVSLKFALPDLRGATAIVTGAGQGLGAAIAVSLAAAGARVVVDGRNPDTLRRTCAAIGAAGGEAESLAGDVSDPEHVQELVALAAGPGGTIDILINNAGIMGPVAPIADISLADWNETLAINVTGVFLASQASLPYLAACGHGKIVNIGSVAGKQPLVNRLPYATSKMALVGLTRTLAQEAAPQGVSVNLVSPYLVEGDRLERVVTSSAKVSGSTADEVREAMTKSTAFGRTVAVDDITSTVLWLCSSATTNITGLDINVSGGAVMY